MAWLNSGRATAIFYKNRIRRPSDGEIGKDEGVLPPGLQAVIEAMASAPHVMFCVKNDQSRYIAANRAFAERSGRKGAGEVIGLRAGDLFPPALAERYELQDQQVLSSGEVLSNQLEVITRPDGSFGWYVSSKSLWLDPDAGTRGLISVSVDLRTPVDAAVPHGRLVAAVDLARREFARNPTVGELAAAAEMTVSQLERTSRRILGVTPKQLVLRFRLEEALRLLSGTDLSIAEVAAQCGYYDQSAFSRQFKRVTGLPPHAYRS